MKKLITISVLLTLSSQLFAASCYPAYIKKAKEIKEKKQTYSQIGGEFYSLHGTVGYYEGVTVADKINNWAQDYLDAIEYGPELMAWSSETPKADWLNSLYSSIKKDCRINDKAQMTIFRGMLHELMEDGTMCPESKTLKHTFLKPRGHFKKVLKEAVASGRFADICSSKEASSDSYRLTKKVSPEKSITGPSPAGTKSGKQ